MDNKALEISMQEEWSRFLARAKLTAPGNARFERLSGAYNGTGRHYHNLRHISECLAQLVHVPDDLPNRVAIEAAIWFHDVVYDPKAKDSEARSADVAASELALMGTDHSFTERVRELILDTRHKTAPKTQAGQFMVDIDLSILGQSPERFDEYERAIRNEYAHVNVADFRTGRAAVLRSFLARDSVYSTLIFTRLYESMARRNLQRSLEQLGD